MCKLCNGDNSVSIPKIDRNIQIQQIVMHYIGEYACINCMSFINSNVSTKSMSIDKAVLTRLYQKRYYALLTQTQRNNFCTYKNRRTSIITTMKLGIRIEHNKRTGYISYTPRLVHKTKLFTLPVQKTFNDAILVKLEYMQKHGHTQGVKQLQNKLKELQNENKTN